MIQILLVVLAVCAPLVRSRPPSAQPIGKSVTSVEGEGTLILNPLLTAWTDEYSHMHAGIRFSYLPRGSGRAILKLMNKEISFATSNGPMTDDQIARAPGRILELPVALDAVVPIYNLPGITRLRLSGRTLADIFLGKITQWDDPAIAHDNPGVNLPRMGIKVAHDFPNHGQVDTFYMADYLLKVSPAFKTTLASSSAWPVSDASAGYKGGAGVTGYITETPGSIGYVWWDRARHSSLTYAAVKNSEGEFVAASQESVTAAAASAVDAIQTQFPDFRVLITNPSGNASYPISYFILFLFYEDSNEKKQHEVIVDFLRWVLTDGQKAAVRLGFPPLPDNLVRLELERLGTKSP